MRKSIRGEAIAFYNALFRKLASFTEPTLSKGVNVTVFSQRNGELCPTSHLLDANATQNIHFL